MNIEGKKELLGLYLSDSEGAHQWLSVLTDLNNRGVKDILICCIDGLKGFPEAIATIYPNTVLFIKSATPLNTLPVKIRRRSWRI